MPLLIRSVDYLQWLADLIISYQPSSSRNARKSTMIDNGRFFHWSESDSKPVIVVYACTH